MAGAHERLVANQQAVAKHVRLIKLTPSQLSSEEVKRSRRKREVPENTRTVHQLLDVIRCQPSHQALALVTGTPGGGRVECHVYVFKSPKQAADMAQIINKVLQEGFARVRRGLERSEIQFEQALNDLAEPSTEEFDGFGDGAVANDAAVAGAASSNDDNNDDDNGPPDIDLDDPDTQAAAVKIQAGFRGMQARRQLAQQQQQQQQQQESQQEENKETFDDIDLNDPETQKAAAKIQAGFRGMQARRQLAQQQESQQQHQQSQRDENKETFDDIDLSDPETQKAAAKIQAGFRGMQTRRQLAQQQQQETQENQQQQQQQKQETFDDIDLNDPATQAAAAKIQAGFRGMQTRRQLAQRESR